jgi:hypothetical protein
VQDVDPLATAARHLLAGIFAKFEAAGIWLGRVEVNGQPGAKIVDQRDRVVGVFAVDTAQGRGSVRAVRGESGEVEASRAGIGSPDMAGTPSRSCPSPCR